MFFCVGSAAMGQTGLLVKLGDGNKHCGWIYRIRANPGRPRGGIVPPAPVLAPGSALGSRPRVALSSAQAPSTRISAGRKIINPRTPVVSLIEGESDVPVPQPRDRSRLAIERRLAQDRVMAAPVE